MREHFEHKTFWLDRAIFDYSDRLLGATASYSNSWTFADGSVATINGSASSPSLLSQTASLSSSFTTSGEGGGEFAMQANQVDSLTINSTNPANQTGTLWFEVAVQVTSSSGKTGYGTSGGFSVGPIGPGILPGQVWGQNFCGSGAEGSAQSQCGSFVIETGHFQFAFGKQFTLSTLTTAGNGMGPGSTQAGSTVSTSILGIYVLDSSGNQVTSGVTVASALGANYAVIATPLSQSTALPHFAAGGPWTTGFYIVNRGSQPGNYALEFYDDSGAAVDVSQNGQAITSLNGTVPANGARYFEVGPPDPMVTSGWVQVTADASVTVQGLLRDNVNGIYYEAAVPASSGSREVIVPFDDTTFGPTGAPIYTGFALANLDPANPANVVCTATNSSGAVIANSVSVPTIAPLGHWANYLFPALAGQLGTIDCVANTKIAALGIRSVGGGPLSTLLVIVN